MGKKEIWAEMARRKVQFHANEEWDTIKLWGLFDWGTVSKLLKSGELLAPGYTRENKTIWVKPTRETWEKHIKPLVDTCTLEQLTQMAGWGNLCK